MRGLEVETSQDHRGCVGAAKIMEREAVESGGGHGRHPGAAAPIAVLEGCTVGLREDHRITVVTRDVLRIEVVGENRHT